MSGSVSRRDFARLFAVGGSAALFADPAWARTTAAPAASPPGHGGTGEAFWKTVRAQFVMPPDLGVLNAANLCPASRPVLEALTARKRQRRPGSLAQNRARLVAAKENTRKALAAFLRVTPEEIVITRNTSEATTSSRAALDLKAGDEVIVFADNHPSNLTAWNEKAKRFGFTRDHRPAEEPAPGRWRLHRRVTPRRSRRGRRCRASRTSPARSAICSRPRTVRAGARARRAVAGRRRADVRPARRRPRRHLSPTSTPAARTSGRAARVSAACSSSTRACTTDLALDLQRLSRRRRHLAHVRKLRPARRSDDDRVRRGVAVPDQDRPGGDRAALARARAAADRRASRRCRT